MYPRRELEDLARLRSAQIHSIDQRRRENVDFVRLVAIPLRWLDRAVLTWRATQSNVDLAMIPIKLLIGRERHAPAGDIRATLRGSIILFTMARRLDRLLLDKNPEETSPKPGP